MKKLLLFIFIQIVTFNFVFSQSINLVPNSSFEDYINCPMNQGEISFAKYWFNGCGYNPDYFNVCANGLSDFGVPNNLINGFQIPLTGNAYAGITIYSYIPDLREYIAVKVIEKLIKSRNYCVKFYTSYGPTSHALDLIGAYLSADSIICVNNGNLFNKTPQICNPYGNVLNDTLNWMKISGSFISAGGEQYMYIGDFYPDTQNTISHFNLTFPNTISYYYIDDVSVCECNDFMPKIGKDTTLCLGQYLLLSANIPKEADSVIYTWQDGSKESTFWVTQPGTYWVSAFIEDYKITVTDSISVNYTDCTVITPQLWIPNSFTPNGDGLNDKFEYGNAALYEIKTYIYNRWGQLIFDGENTDYWDGTYKGKILATEIYTYRIETIDKASKEKKVYNGKVTVL